MQFQPFETLPIPVKEQFTCGKYQTCPGLSFFNGARIADSRHYMRHEVARIELIAPQWSPSMARIQRLKQSEMPKKPPKNLE